LEPGTANVSGRVRWRLWLNAPTSHASEVILTFGKSLFFAFGSSAAGVDTVACQATVDAGGDRPVDGNGRPLVIRSAKAALVLERTADRTRARIVDGDLLSNLLLANETRYPIALTNAVFVVRELRSLVLMGELTNGRMTCGMLALTWPIYSYLP